MAIVAAELAVTMTMATTGSAIALSGVLLDDADGDGALNEAALAASRLAEGGGGEPVEVTHGAGGRVMQEAAVWDS